MKKVGLLFAVVLSLMIITGINASAAVEVPDKDKEWAGNPYMVLEEDSPYVIRMNSFAKNAMDAYKKDKSGNLMWLVWGYTAPESNLRGDETLGKYAKEAMSKTFSELEKTPDTNMWSHTGYLCVLFMWTKAESIPSEYEKWKKQLLPSIAQYDNIGETKGYSALYEKYIADPDYIERTLVNEDLQIAGIMQLGAVIYDKSDWADMAKKIIYLDSRRQSKDGAFAYYGNSGTIDCYSNFEQGWLGMYYQFSKDPLAEEMLIKAAKATIDKCATGVTWSGEGPWWKDDFNAGGFLYAPVVVSGVSKDQRTASVANFRLGYGQNHVGLYIAAPFYDSSIETTDDWCDDLCRYSYNISGVKLRSGIWNVSMQNRSRAAGAVTMNYLSESLYARESESYMMYANMLIVPAGGTVPSNPYRSSSYFAVAEGQENNYGAIAGEDFIVSGKKWIPSVTSTSHNEPVNENWESVQIWYADSKGLAGWMTLTAQANNEIGGIYGVVKTGPEETEISEDNNSFKQKNIKYDVYGTNVESISQSDANHFQIALKDGQAGTIKKDTTIGLGIAASPLDNEQASVEVLSFKGALEIAVRRSDLDCIIVYNPTDEAVTYENNLGSLSYYKSKADGEYEKGSWGGSTTLEKNQIVIIFKSRGEITQLDKAGDLETVISKNKEYEQIENPFTDIDTCWAKQDILDMVSIGAANGKGDGKFDPNGTISRAEFTALVLRTLGISEASYSGAYSDISGGEWYAGIMQSAKDNKIIHEAMTFGDVANPNAPITREEMCAIAAKAYEYKMGRALPRKEMSFTDKDMIAPWCESYIKGAAAAGVVTGYEDGSFGAKKNSSRSEAVVIVKRLYELF